PGRGDGVRREVLADGGVDHLRADVRRAIPVEGRLRSVARSRAEAPVQSQSLPLQLALALGLRQRRYGQPGPASVRRGAVGPEQTGAPDENPVGGRILRARVVAGNARRADDDVRV